jgi:hypothetical protein
MIVYTASADNPADAVTQERKSGEPLNWMTSAVPTTYTAPSLRSTTMYGRSQVPSPPVEGADCRGGVRAQGRLPGHRRQRGTAEGAPSVVRDGRSASAEGKIVGIPHHRADGRVESSAGHRVAVDAARLNLRPVDDDGAAGLDDLRFAAVPVAVPAGRLALTSTMVAGRDGA